MSHRRRPSPDRRRAAVAALTLACAGLLDASGPAAAATVEVRAGTLVYAAAAGEANLIEIRAGGVAGSYRVRDGGGEVRLLPLPGCRPDPEPAVPPQLPVASALCEGVERGMSIDAGDGDDALKLLELPGAAAVALGDGSDTCECAANGARVDGGAGDDVISGSTARDTLAGGAGDDVLAGVPALADASSARPLGDVIDGGSGDDLLVGGRGEDRFEGGVGTDTVDYSARRSGVVVILDGRRGDGEPGEDDDIAADVEAVLTGAGDDYMRGGDGPERIATGAGNDTIDPGGGADIVDAGAGDDTIAARDGARDEIGCGTEGDAVTVDESDVLSKSDCELVELPAAPAVDVAPPVTATPPPPPRPAPLALTLVARRAGHAPRRTLRLTGRIVLAAGTPAQVCAGGRVALTLRSGRRRATVDAALRPDCGYDLVAPLPWRRIARVIAIARFAGTPVLAPVVSRPVRVRMRCRRSAC